MNPYCGKCNKEMTPKNSQIAPELFLCDDCAITFPELQDRVKPPLPSKDDEIAQLRERLEQAEAKATVYRGHLRLDFEQSTRKNRAANDHDLLCRDLDFIAERLGPVLTNPDPAAEELLRDKRIADAARKVEIAKRGKKRGLGQPHIMFTERIQNAEQEFWQLVRQSLASEQRTQEEK